ncbi:endo-beta-glucanase [Russula compacta]|nr:endo-beta-glucanase [Russula compacta]
MMFISTSTVALSVLLAAGSARAATYSVVDDFQAASFLSGFSFFSQPDPTHGRVNYVTREEALSRGLATVQGTRFILRADNTTTLSPGGPGRDSFRIISNNRYGTHVSVFDVQHMPQGCATWPALWELGDTWPDGGEVDILEGVNDQVPNASSLHTGPDCHMPPDRSQTGITTGSDCYVYTTNNAGCGVRTTAPNNYGPQFNANGGGWYAMERTTTSIKIWFWPRGFPNVPSDVLNGSGSINTDDWGIPTANYPNTLCEIDKKFTDSNIIINLTLCELSFFVHGGLVRVSWC